MEASWELGYSGIDKQQKGCVINTNYAIRWCDQDTGYPICVNDNVVNCQEALMTMWPYEIIQYSKYGIAHSYFSETMVECIAAIWIYSFWTDGRCHPHDHAACAKIQELVQWSRCSMWFHSSHERYLSWLVITRKYNTWVIVGWRGLWTNPYWGNRFQMILLAWMGFNHQKMKI